MRAPIGGRERNPWPPLTGSGDWAVVRTDDRRLAAGVAAILGRHGCGSAPPRRFPAGSLPVFAVGEDLVLKLFPPHEGEAQQTEAAALNAVDGRLSVPTPKVVAADALHGWPYVLMTRCAGQPLRGVWPRLSARARRRVVGEVGRMMAELHQITGDKIGARGLGGPRAWTSFLAAQRRGAVERQRDRGLGRPWLEQIDPFLSAALGAGLVELRPPDELVLLHTEIMLEHVLASDAGGAWRCTGLVDFEPAMLGAPGYELASVGLFVTEGDPALFTALLDAYGLEPRRGPALAEACLAYALLHRYSNLPWYLRRLAPPPAVDTLAGLARCWFDSRR